MPFPSHIPICDPHFHVWDNKVNPKNLNLGPIADGPLGVYLTKDIKVATASLPYVAGVHVETVVGQKEGGFIIDTVEETRFVRSDIAGFGSCAPFGICAYVHLGREDAAKVIAQHLVAGGARFVGVRMILNYCAEDPTLTWPQVESDDFLKPLDAGGNLYFGKNLALLSRLGLVYDMHANWWQLESAAAKLFSLGNDCPTVVVDHLGCPKLGCNFEEDAKRLASWKTGMAALAKNDQVHIKISGLEYIYGGWLVAGSKAREVVRECVFFVLKHFGLRRCMVASINPVDLAMGGKVCPARASAYLFRFIHSQPSISYLFPIVTVGLCRLI